MGRSLVVLVSLLSAMGLGMERWDTPPDIRDDWEARSEKLYRCIASPEPISWVEVSDAIRGLTASYAAAVGLRVKLGEGTGHDR